jgi:hypothetical protein
MRLFIHIEMASFYALPNMRPGLNGLSELFFWFSAAALPPPKTRKKRVV